MGGAFYQRHISVSMAFCILVSLFVFELSGCQIFPTSQTTTVPQATPVSSVAIKSSMPSSHPSEQSRFRPTFERGIVFPRWGKDGFSPKDTAWTTGLTAIHAQTGAQWLELPIPLGQDNGQSVTVSNDGAPLPQYVRKAVAAAHIDGYKVFMVPLHLVNIPEGWAASVQFTTYDEESAWFNSLFAAYKPYLQIAQDEGVEQVSIGTELVWMQANASPVLWNHYIDNIRSVYHGNLTYDTNWGDIYNSIPTWMHNPHLSAIGVSEYIPLTDTQSSVDKSQIQGLWAQKIQAPLDDFSQRSGKQIILSEIGYRNSWDTFWHTWDYSSHLPLNPQAQADGVNAALTLSFADPHIQGTFFWGWQDTGPFDLAGHPAVGVMHSWYTK